jgi:hypothetical protein
MDTRHMETRSNSSVLTFTVELKGKRGWYGFMGNYADLFAARESASKEAAAYNVEARVTDSDGQVWS